MNDKTLISNYSDIVNDMINSDVDTMAVEGMICESFYQNNAVVVCGETATLACLRYSLGEKCKDKTVFHVKFDRDKYLLKNISIDAILKRCLLNSFSYLDNVSLAKAESLLSDDSILFIENYNIGAPSPYMRHLLALDCRILVSTKNEMMNTGTNIVCIDERNFCSKKVFPDFSLLDCQRKELMMTLCAILRYVDGCSEIVSSKRGVFDEESVRFYLESLADELDFLIKHGFVKKCSNGRLYIDEAVSDYVFNELRPDAVNCKTYIGFAHNICRFKIDQENKDVYAKLVAEGKYNAFVSSEEFILSYTHFSQTDENRGEILYNSLFSLALEKCAMHGGAFYNGCLRIRNMDYFLLSLKKSLEDEKFASFIYDIFPEKRYLPVAYTYFVKSNLDIVRLVICFIRNMTTRMYAVNENILNLLFTSMESIMDYVQNDVKNNRDKLLIFDDVIRLCQETFSHCEVIDDNGVYNVARDSYEGHTLFYLCEKHCDERNALSLAIGYSSLTLKLYGLYQKYLDKWLELFSLCGVMPQNAIFKQLNDEKITERKYVRQVISSHFLRVVNGYDKYYDFLCDKNKSINVYEYHLDETIKERIDANKRYLERGFDGGTKTGAERYGKMIIGTVCNSDNVFRTVLPVLSFDYPVNDELYKYLIKSDFSSIICAKENFANLHKQMLLETLVFMYRDDSKKKNLTALYETLITKLCENVTQNASSEKRLSEMVNTMFVNVKFRQLTTVSKTEDLPKDDFATKLFERYKQSDYKYCDSLISEAIHSAIKGEAQIYSVDEIEKALEVFVYEKLMTEEKTEIEGAVRFAKQICGENFVLKPGRILNEK